MKRASAGIFLSFMSLVGCASIPSGHRGVLMRASGEREILREGMHFKPPFSLLDVFDLQAQQRTEDFTGVTADGGSVEAKASLVAFHVNEQDLLELQMVYGQRYYETVLKPIVRAAARAVFGEFTALELITTGQAEAQARMSQRIATTLGTIPIQVSGIQLRSIRLTMPATQKAITQKTVWQQRAQTQPSRIKIRINEANALRERGKGIRDAHAAEAPGLTRQVLGHLNNRSWNALMTGRAVSVVVQSDPNELIEVDP